MSPPELPIDVELEPDDLEAADRLREGAERILAECGKVIVGQKDVLEQLLIALFAQGHCLLVGVPGLAKTLMIRTLADAMDLTFNRVQFTPDLMPSDITGTDMLQEDQPPGTGRSGSCAGRSSPTSCWPTRSTAPRRRRRRPCSRPCRRSR